MAKIEYDFREQLHGVSHGPEIYNEPITYVEDTRPIYERNIERAVFFVLGGISGWLVALVCLTFLGA